jgi:hypothetical protein
MKLHIQKFRSSVTVKIAALFIFSGGLMQMTGHAQGWSWEKVANNLNSMPGAGTNTFNSYNQPSVNDSGFLVFRARSKGPNPVSGIYVRNLLVPDSPVERIADRSTVVPPPNNTVYQSDGMLASFNEFPSIPRIDMRTKTIATRGNSTPVWTYWLGDTETRAGTTGLFVYSDTPSSLVTAVTLLGAVPPPTNAVPGENYFPFMAVPGAAPGTKFDVFPGSPALAENGNVIVFKGNYTEDNIGKTGVFYRDYSGGQGLLPVELIANTATVIPNLPPGVSNVTFGSTAPPSAADRTMVFAGYDNEDFPTNGGIYRAELMPSPPLETLVGIGDPVPGETNAAFTQFGEALSFDGRYLGFWAAWGMEKKTLWLDCPTDGNKDVLEYCRTYFGDNYPVQVSVHQGIFVLDTLTGTLYPIARTGSEFADFVYWNFSGKPPGVGGSEEESGELPRWRFTSFLAVSGGPGGNFMIAFKARRGEIDPVENNYTNPVDGIYLGNQSGWITMLDTTMDGQLVDPAAPVGSKITTLGLERESFRGDWLAFAASMLEPISTESMAGVYATKVPPGVLHPPMITQVTKFDDHLQLQGTNGFPGGGYVVLQSAELTTPAKYWQPVLTNHFAPDGCFDDSVPVSDEGLPQFFRLKRQ